MCGGIDKQTYGFFRIVPHPDVDPVFQLLVQDVAQVVHVPRHLFQLIGDAGVVGVGPDDGGRLLDAFNVVEVVFLQLASLQDPHFVFLVYALEVDVSDEYLLDGVVFRPSFRLVVGA